MADELTASSKPTRSGGKNTSTMQLSARDEFEILESQAADCVRAGIRAGWAELRPGGQLVLVFEDGHICKKCQHPYIGEKCWHCDV